MVVPEDMVERGCKGMWVYAGLDDRGRGERRLQLCTQCRGERGEVQGQMQLCRRGCVLGMLFDQLNLACAPMDD
jgi:hypothetical protein